MSDIQEPAQAGLDSAAPMPARPLRVLLVEDSADDAALIVRALHSGGFAPTWERVDTAEAMHAALACQPWDIVIADYTMPHFSGPAALRLVQESGLDLPFIVVSGTIGEDVAVAAMKGGAHDYVMKSDLARLVPAIERELRDAEARRERRRAEEALRRSEERFALAVAGANDGIWDWNFDVHEHYFSPRWKSILGFADSELHNRIEEWHHRIHPEDVDRVAEDLGDHLSGVTPHFRSRHRLRHKDGTYRWVLARALALRDPAGKAHRIAGSLTDITERTRAEDALRESEERFRLTVENASDMILIVGADGTLRYQSPSVQWTLGYPPEQLLGTNAFTYIHPSDLAAVADAFKVALTTPDAGSMVELRVRHRDGSWRVLEAVANCQVDNPSIAGFVVNARDITERKRAEAVRAELEERLRQSQKLDAIGRLAGGVAHDFNNQLTVIKGCAQFLLASLAADDPRRVDAERIDATVSRGAQLVHQLLAFSREQPVEPQSLNLDDLVHEMIPMLHPLLGEQITLRVAPAPALWPVRADPMQIERVVMNLAANAKDAMSGTGTLSVEAANVEIDDAARHRVGEGLEPGAYVMLTVRDSGCGMTPEVRERIFEPFFTTKPPGKGTGLGLATVYGIVKQHGGDIACESIPGRGTAFSVYLPRDENAVRSPRLQRARAARSDQFPHRRTTVLVAEDEDGVREVVKQALEDFGCTVHVAAGLKQALAAPVDGPIHLLVTDVQMPDGNGRTLARRLAQTNPSMKILFMSGYGDEPIGGPDFVGAGFLHKPFGLDDLLHKARELLST